MSEEQDPQPLLSGWPDETRGQDENWMAKYPAELQQVARRYGKDCFELTMWVGAMNEAIRTCFASKPPKQVQQALVMLSGCMNELGMLALKGAGTEQAVFLSCKRDIETLAMLAQPVQSCIVLPS